MEFGNRLTYYVLLQFFVSGWFLLNKNIEKYSFQEQ